MQHDSSAALTALTAYEKAREFAQHHDSKILQHDETDSVILRYCIGLAQVNSGMKANINSAIALFNDISECEGKNYLFAFFGLGVAYQMLNYFEMAVPWLERGLRAINNGVQIPGRRSSWPGLSGNIIDETDEVKLKEKLANLLEECQHPEPPDAKCTYASCEEVKREIYTTDIPFVGYVSLRCKERCLLSFHRSCWQKHKLDKNLKTNKEYLGKECLTPDCGTVIIELDVTDHGDHTNTIKSQEISETPEGTKVAVKKTKERTLPSAENLRRKEEKKKRRKEEKKKRRNERKVENESMVLEVESDEVNEVLIPCIDEMVQLESKTNDGNLCKVGA